LLRLTLISSILKLNLLYPLLHPMHLSRFAGFCRCNKKFNFSIYDFKFTILSIFRPQKKPRIIRGFLHIIPPILFAYLNPLYCITMFRDFRLSLNSFCLYM